MQIYPIIYKLYKFICTVFFPQIITNQLKNGRWLNVILKILKANRLNSQTSQKKIKEFAFFIISARIYHAIVHVRAGNVIREREKYEWNAKSTSRISVCVCIQIFFFLRSGIHYATCSHDRYDCVSIMICKIFINMNPIAYRHYYFCSVARTIKRNDTRIKRNEIWQDKLHNVWDDNGRETHWNRDSPNTCNF